MTDRDQEIQTRLDRDPGELDSSEPVSASVDDIAYRRLYHELAISTARLKPDFSSSIMLRILKEKLKRAKWESTVNSFLLSGLLVASLSLAFYLFSYLDYFQLDVQYRQTLTAIAISSISYVLPCVIALASLAGVDQIIVRWQQSP